MPNMKNARMTSPFVPYNLQAIVKETMPNYTKADKIIVHNDNNMNIKNVKVNYDKNL